MSANNKLSDPGSVSVTSGISTKSKTDFAFGCILYHQSTLRSLEEMYSSRQEKAGLLLHYALDFT